MSVSVPYVLEGGEGEVLRWFGATLTVKACGPAFDVALVAATAGGEPPPHVHDDADEGLFVLAGSLLVRVGAETLAAPAGSFVFVPRGLSHTFEVESGDARLLLLASPPGALSDYASDGGSATS